MKTLVVAISAIALAGVLAGQGRTGGSDAAERLHKLFDREWDYAMRENPVRASLLGDRRFNDRWPEVSLPAEERRQAHRRALVAEISQIDRNALAPTDRVSYDLFLRQVEERIARHPFRLYLMPLDMRSGVHTSHELTETLRFREEKDYRDWVARLRAFPAYVNGTIALMREGTAARVMQPRLIVDRVIGQLDKQLTDDPTRSPYYAPFRAPSANGAAAAAIAGIATEAQQAIRADVTPALRRLRTFLADEYTPKAFEQVGIWQIPRGDEAYVALTREFTTTSMTPREVHEVGLAEVKRIRGQMEQVMRQVGFTGTLKEFFQTLRTDPRFYHKSPEALLAAYRATAKRIDPTLVKLFGRLPRAPYGVEPIPDITAPDTTTAYYNQPAADGSRAGTYYVNLYKPETRPTWEMMALSLHEAVPGHHLQIALAQELDLPKFRRYAGYTAFVEGWALYAESLGEEVGLYDDPYSKFGQLTYEMWRAVRLVVDTGMHQMRWSRQQAIDYFLDNAAKTELDVTNEIDRYIGWPGQALAYKVGELKIKELRKKAERARADRFDVRAFHDVVLREGAVTLDVLEMQVAEWLAGGSGTKP
jgi:uncharacterized protein (DUF885 family)